MSLIVEQQAVASPASTATTTAQNVVDCTAQEIRSLLASSGADSDILLDFVNDISLEMLRASRWNFLLSDSKYFVTQKGISDYWIGATGSAPAGYYDTVLNLTDVGKMKNDTVFDRSNYFQVFGVREMPLKDLIAHPSTIPQYGTPAGFRHQDIHPYRLHIYPAPDNNNTYKPIPNAPLCTTVVSGALAARTYFVKQTFVDSSGGESTASEATRIYVPANSLLKVRAPQPPVTKGASGIEFNKYRVYASTTEDAETAQVAATLTSSDWTEPGSGLVAGAALPSSNAIEELRGYVIEFRYYKLRSQLTALNQTLQIPDDYKDIVCAGVNWRAFKYLKRDDEARIWHDVYKDGIRQIVRDMNLFPKVDFIRPA